MVTCEFDLLDLTGEPAGRVLLRIDQIIAVEVRMLNDVAATMVELVSGSRRFLRHDYERVTMLVSEFSTYRVAE